MVWATVALAGVGLLIALPVVAHVYLGGGWGLGAVGLIPLVAAVVGLIACRRGNVRAAAWTLASMGMLLVLAIFGFGASYVDRYQVSPALAEAIAEATPTGKQPAIASYRFFRPSFVFYTDRPVDEFRDPEQVTAFFAAHPADAFLITTDERIEQLESSLPPGVAVLEVRRRFLQEGNVLLLGRRAPLVSTAHQPAANDESRTAF